MQAEKRSVEHVFFIAWVLSLTATAGSLFFSEIMKFIPCELCWFQRIFMYPLVVVLGMAVVKKDYRQSLYGFVLAVIGGCISLYHYMVQKVPALHDLGNACGIIPCNTDYLNWFGFITIPFLALVAFILIAASLFYVWRSGKGNEA